MPPNRQAGASTRCSIVASASPAFLAHGRLLGPARSALPSMTIDLDRCSFTTSFSMNLQGQTSSATRSPTTRWPHAPSVTIFPPPCSSRAPISSPPPPHMPRSSVRAQRAPLATGACQLYKSTLKTKRPCSKASKASLYQQR